jgi:hypothetical protein
MAESLGPDNADLRETMRDGVGSRWMPKPGAPILSTRCVCYIIPLNWAASVRMGAPDMLR